MAFFNSFAGAGLAFLGAALAALLCCIGSAKGTGMVGEAATGLLAEDANKFGACLVLQVIPGSQGLYGIVIFFMALMQMGVFGGADLSVITVTQGFWLFAACLPMMFGGIFSAMYQGRVAASCINIVAKKPDDWAKGIILCVIVETYAILSLLASIMMIINIKVG